MFRVFLVAICLLFGATAQARDYRLLELDDLKMQYFKIENNRDPYYPYFDKEGHEDDEHWVYGTAVMFDLTLAQYKWLRMHWGNRVHGESTNAQFRSTGWQFRWGLQMGEKVEFFYDHHSQHILERDPLPSDLYSNRSYRLQNYVGAEITFYQRKGR